MTNQAPIHQKSAHPAHHALDPSWLALPFWEDRHRDIANDLEDWVATHKDQVASIADLPVEKAGPAFVALLAKGGWLDVATGFREGSYQPDFRAICLCRAAFAYLADLCDFAFAIQALAAYPLVVAGNGKAHEHHLEQLRSGAAIGAFALSEPHAGSDLASITTSADITDEGYRLNGKKSWIGNAGIADLVCVLARTGGPKAMGLSLFVVSAASHGLTQNEAVQLAAPRPFGGITLKDCNVDQSMLVGATGLGFTLAVDTLDKFRMTVGAAAIGFARCAMGAATTYVKTRTVADGPLAQTQIIKTQLADMATELSAAQLLVAHAAWSMDTHLPDASARSAMAKYQATEAAQRIVDRALQMHGAAGCVAGTIPEKLYRQIRSLRIYEGTSEIQQLIIGEAVLAGHLAQP